MTFDPGKPLAALLVMALLGGAASAQNNPDAEARFAMGVSHLREGRLDMALEDFQKAAKLDPKNPYVMKGLGQAYAAKRKWGDAISAFLDRCDGGRHARTRSHHQQHQPAGDAHRPHRRHGPPGPGDVDPDPALSR